MPLLAHLRNIKLEKQAIYRNDVLLGLILGLYYGWNSVVTGLLVAFALMGFASVLAIFHKVMLGEYDPNLSIPLGPFMALSAIIIYFFG